MEGQPVIQRYRFTLGVLVGFFALLIIPNVIDATVQSYYAARDDAPIESTIATFWWHLTDY